MLYPLILTSLAGLATLIGVIPIFIKIKNKDYIISAACAFASGVMICISIFDLIPESLRYLSINFNSFYKYYFNSSSICFLILSISVKNKFIPFDFNFNKFLKFSNIIFPNASGIFAGLPSTVCT